MLLNCLEEFGKQINSEDRQFLKDSYNSALKNLPEDEASLKALEAYAEKLAQEANEMRVKAGFSETPSEKLDTESIRTKFSKILNNIEDLYFQPQKSAEMKRWNEIVGADLGELPGKMKIELDSPESYRIKLNAEAAEFLRRVYQQIRFEISGQKGFELPFKAMFEILQNPEKANEFSTKAVKFIRDQAQKAKTLGYAPLEVLKMNNLADSIELAARNGKGGFIFYIDDAYLPEEEFHRAGFMAFNAAISRDRFADDLNEEKLVKKYKEVYADYLKEFHPDVRDAVAWDETAAVIARGGGEEIGASEDEEVKYLAKFFESMAKRLEQKGLDVKTALQNYDAVREKRINEQIRQFKGKRTSETRSDSEISGGSSERSEGIAGEDPAESQNEQNRAGAGSSDGIGRAEFKKTGLASLPQTMREAGYQAEDKEYEIQTNADTRRAAIEMADRSDAEARIIEALTEGRELGAKDTAFALELVKRLSREARKTDDPKIALAKREKAAEIADLLDERLRAAGQTIQAVNLIEHLDPDMILRTAQKRLKRTNPEATISQEIADDLIKKAEELEAAKNDLEKKYKRLEKRFDKYKSENKGVRKSSKRSRNGISKARESVIKNLAAKEDEILTKFKNIFGGFVAGQKAAEIAQSGQKAVEISEPKPVILTQEQISELAKFGALEMARGFYKTGEKVFERRLREIFGDAVIPYAAEIWAKSRFEYIKQLRSARKANQIASLAEANPDLSETEIEDLYQENVQKMREAQRLANEHLKRAREILGLSSTAVSINAVQRELIETDLDNNVRQMALLLADPENRPGLKTLRKIATEEMGMDPAEAENAIEAAVRELDKIKAGFKKRSLENKNLTKEEEAKLKREKGEILKSYKDIFEKVRGKMSRKKTNLPKLTKLQRRFLSESDSRKTGNVVRTAALMISNPKTAGYDPISRALRDLYPAEVPDGATADGLIKEALKFVNEIKEDLKKQAQDKRTGKLTEEEKAELDAATKRQSKAYRELNNRLDSLSKIPVGKLAVAGHYAGRLRRIYKGLLVSAISTAFPNLYGGALTIGTRTLTDIVDLALQKFQKKMGREIIGGSEIFPETSFADVIAMKAFQGVVSSRMAEGILDRFPSSFEKLFGRYNADIESVGDAVKIPYLTKGFETAEWLVDKANIFNQIQEFMMRRAEFLRQMYQIAAGKGLKLDEVWETRKLENVFSEEDIQRAVNAALEATYAMPVNSNSVIGRLIQSYNNKMNTSLWALAAPIEPAIFATFMYNAGKFVTDYVPPLHVVKHIFSSEKYSTRNAAQLAVGTFYFALGLALVRAFGGDDDRWYVLNIAGVPVDIRRYAPFASFVYLGDVANRAYEGRYPIEKWEDAVEQFLGLNTRAMTGNAFLEAISLSAKGATGGDDRYGERLAQLGSNLAGRTVSSVFRPFRPLKDLAAQFIESEGIEYDYYDSPFMAELHKSIPLSSLMWQYAPKKDYVTGKTKEMRLPALNILGVSVQEEIYRQQTAAEEAANSFREPKKMESEKLPDEKRRSDTIRSISKAFEIGIDASQAVDRAVSEGIIKQSLGEIMKRNKGKIPLEIAIERNRLTLNERKMLLRHANEEEKPVLENLIKKSEEQTVKSESKLAAKAAKEDHVNDLIKRRQKLGNAPTKEELKGFDDDVQTLVKDKIISGKEAAAIRSGLTKNVFDVEMSNQASRSVEVFNNTVKNANETEKKQLITALRLKFFSSTSLESKKAYYEALKPFLSVSDNEIMEKQLNRLAHK